jgi:hypothetical protein
MAVNIHQLAGSRTNWPAWNMRGRIKRVDSHGNVIEGEYAFGGEFVRVSPKYVKGGRTYRVRPERPAMFFMFWCYEHTLLPTPLTAEECEAGWAVEILDWLWNANKHVFYKLESPFAACDHATQPSHRVGFSFCIPQILVEETGSVRGSKGGHGGMMPAHVQGNGENHEALRKKIEEMRAKASRPEGNVPAKGKK